MTRTSALIPGGTVELDGSARDPFSPFQAAFHQTYHNPTYLMIADNLPPGPHSLTIRVWADRESGSRGNWTRLGYFLVRRVGAK